MCKIVCVYKCVCQRDRLSLSKLLSPLTFACDMAWEGGGDDNT